MVKRRYLLMIIAGVLFNHYHVSFVQGQNLVPNPGFEHYSSCPIFASQLDSAVPWFNPTLGTPEFYHACAAYSSGVSVPRQYTGGFQYPRTGNGHAGLYVYRTDVPEMREYAEIQLTESLKAGTCYYFEMFVNQPNSFSHVSDGIGALITKGKLKVNTGFVLPFIPQIDNPAGNLIDDTAGWTRVSGYFTAKGGEDHLVIGNFRDDAHTQHQLYNPNTWYTNSAYLFVDDISLTPSAVNVNLGPDTTLCRTQEILLSAGGTGTSWLWNTGAITPEYLVTHEGLYWVEAGLGDCRIRDSIQIAYLDSPPADLPADTSLCPGDEITLNAGAGDAQYLWSDFSVSPYLTVNNAGTWWLRVSNRCGSNSDTIVINYADCFCKLTVPNVFTPNGDLVNEQFKPLIDCRLYRYSLKIFNRWGIQVFKTENPAEGWNGMIGPVNAAEGTYFWMITYTGNDNGIEQSRSKNGALTLFR